MVSDLFHSPNRGSFHLSLTVLVRYRFLLVFSLTGWSRQIPTGFHVPRGTQVPFKSFFSFVYKTFTFYGGSFPDPSTTKEICNSFIIKDRWALQPPSQGSVIRKQESGIYNLIFLDLTDPRSPITDPRPRFGLFPFRSPLLRESLLFSFPFPT